MIKTLLISLSLLVCFCNWTYADYLTELEENIQTRIQNPIASRHPQTLNELSQAVFYLELAKKVRAGETIKVDAEQQIIRSLLQKLFKGR